MYNDYVYYIPEWIAIAVAMIIGLAALAVLVGTIILAVKNTKAKSNPYETQIKYKKTMIGMLIAAIVISVIYDLFSIRIDYTDLYITPYVFFNLTPCILALVFVCPKSRKLNPRIFISLIAGSVLICILRFIEERIDLRYFFRYMFYDPISLITGLWLLGTIAGLIIAIVAAARGSRSKLPLIIAGGLATFLFVAVISVESYISLARSFNSVWEIILAPLYMSSEYILLALLFATLCLIGLNIPAYMNTASVPMKTQPQHVSPEQALRSLDALRSAGLLTEEEYKAKRAEILDNI